MWIAFYIQYNFHTCSWWLHYGVRDQRSICYTPMRSRHRRVLPVAVTFGDVFFHETEQG